SIRWKATRRPSVSQTVTLMLTARLCALARAAWMARFASASLIDMSFAEMDRFQYCVLEFWPCCQCFTITRAGGDRCTAEFRLDLSALGQPRPSWPRRQVHFVRFAPKAAVADQSVIRWLVPQPSRLSARQVCGAGMAGRLYHASP